MGRFSGQNNNHLLIIILIFAVTLLNISCNAFAVPQITILSYSESVFVDQQNTIRANITDNESSISTVLLSITEPENNNYNMQEISAGIYEYNLTPALADNYYFYIWAMSSDTSSNTSSTRIFISMDDRPSIDNVIDNPDPVVVLQQSIGIYANITDPDNNLDEVWLEIIYPENQSQNQTMTNISGTFTASYTPIYMLTYRYTIWANDTKGNLRSAETCSMTDCYLKEYEFISQDPSPDIRDLKTDKNNFYLRLPQADPIPNVTLSANITDQYGTLDKVWISIYYPNATLALTQELSSPSEIYSYTYIPGTGGTYTYYFNATDVSGTSASEFKTFTTIVSAPLISNIHIDPVHMMIPIGNTVSISTHVTDPHNDLESVWIQIISPVSKKILMTNTIGNTYELNYILENEDIHRFFILANDSRNNIVSSANLVFSDERVTDDLNVSMTSAPFCCAKYDYLSFDIASNYTHYSTYNPFLDYTVLKLFETHSLLSNCGNVEINITNNCMALRKEIIEEDQVNITITGDTSTPIIAYCCWNEHRLFSNHGIPLAYGTYVPGYGASGGFSWFCEWEKSILPIPPFLINSFEEFWMYFSYEVLYEGWYNITASASYERYNQSDCDLYGYNTDLCSCDKSTSKTIRFLKKEERGTFPQPIPHPMPIPMSGEFLSEPDIVIIREMPQYIYQNNETCTLSDPWNTCTYTRIKLILYNRGSEPAYYVSLNDTSIISNDDHTNHCSIGAGECNPLAYRCTNNSDYSCTEYNGTAYLSGISFELPEPIEPRSYVLLEYDFIPTNNSIYTNLGTQSFYDFDAEINYIRKTMVGTFNVNLTKNATESHVTFNPDNADRLYLNKRAAFSYEIDSSLDISGENRNFPVDTYTIFNVNLRALLGNEQIVPLWESKINLPDSWSVAGCSKDVNSDCDCSYSNIEHWVKCERSGGNITDLQDLNFHFIAKTTEISDFLLDIDSFDSSSMIEEYIPGIFTISNPVERVTLNNPDIVMIREMMPYTSQKSNCTSEEPWGNCTNIPIRLIIYNRGAGIANNVKVKDSYMPGYCSQNDSTLCIPVAHRCIEGTEQIACNSTNTTNSTANKAETRPYTCYAGNRTLNQSYMEFNITTPIYPFDYRIIEYEFIPAKDQTVYTDDTYYEFNSETNFQNNQNQSMAEAYETDAVYNPYGANFLHLSNRTAFNYNIEIEKQSSNDTSYRDFAYGINTTFDLRITAHTSDLEIIAPWHIELSLPYSWVLEDCTSDDAGVDCNFNNTQHWIKINSSYNLTDHQTFTFHIDAAAREMKDFLTPLYSTDSFDTTPMDSTYLPGLWTISRLTHLVNITILEPYPSPVPQPEPEPTPTPTPVPVPTPEPVTEFEPDRQMILSIKPLNWTLQTYQGSAIPVMFEITNLGNTTIENLILDAVHFEGWEYGAAEIAKLEAGETVNRTIVITPAKDANPGYYVLPVRGIVNDTETLDIAFFQLHVIEGASKARLKILEFSNVLELDQSTDTFIPVLLKNTGTIDLHNITIELQNLDDCITGTEFFNYALKVNETGVAYFKITTAKEPKTCKGSIIISSDEGAFVFSTFRLTIKPPAPMIPADYTTYILLGLYALVLTVYALYRRKQTSKEKQKLKENSEEEDDTG